LAILRTVWAPVRLPCVLHCFTGNSEQALECLDLGFFLSYGGVTTFPKATEVREAARITPAERMLIETDAPYLAPVPHRGKRNEPAYVAHTANVIAGVRGVPLEEFAARTTLNFECIMGLGRTGSTGMFSKIRQSVLGHEISELVQLDLAMVEREIGVESVASIEAITTINQYLQAGGGKRLRPVLL